MVRARPLVVALLAFGFLFVAAPWVDAAMAAAPDPHPSAKGSKQAPAPDPYQAPVQEPPSQAEPTPVTEVTEPVTRVETAPSTGSATRTETEKPTNTSTPAPRTQRKTKPKPQAEVVAAPQRKRLSEPVRIDVPTAEARPLLLGGLALTALALASGSLLFLITRAGDARMGRWEAKS